MSCIVYRKDKKTGTTYAFRQESYRDPVTKKPRNTKVYLGRVDPDTQLIVPKGKEGHHNTTKLGTGNQSDTPVGEAAKIIEKQTAQIESLKQQLLSKEQQVQKLLDTIKSLHASTASILKEMEPGKK